jgi:flagellar hook-length control protein FliK
MVTNSISQSASAAQTLGESTMTSTVRANSKEVATQGLGFAFALLKSLARVVSGAAPQNEPVMMAGNAIPNSQIEEKGSGDVSGRTSGPVVSEQHAVISAPPTAKKSLPRPADRLRDSSSVGSTLVATQSITVLSPIPATTLLHLANLDSGGYRVEAASPNPHDSSMPMKSFQMFEPASLPNLAISGLPVLAEDSKTPSVTPMEKVPADAARSQQPLPVMGSEPRKLATRSEDRAVSPKVSSLPAPVNPPDVLTARTNNIQPRGLSAEPSRENSGPVPNHQSAAPKAQQTAVLANDAVQAPPITKAEWSGGNTLPSNGNPGADPSGSSFPLPDGFLNGVVNSMPSAIPVVKPIPAPPIQVMAPAGIAGKLALDVPERVPPTDIIAEARSTAPASNAVATGSGASNSPKAANRAAAPGIAEVKYRESTTGNASSGVEENIHKDGGKNIADHALNFAIDHRQAHPASVMPEAGTAGHPKLEMTAPVRASQEAVDPSVSPSKSVSGDGNAKGDVASPLLKEGPHSDVLISPQGSDQIKPATIQSAQLVSEASKSDVRIALQGEQMGRVELHAKMTGDQVSASITAEHPDTHAFLSVQLPSLHQLLNERHLQVSEIILFHDSLSPSGSSQDDGAHAKREERSPQRTHDRGLTGGADAEAAAGTSDPRMGAGRIFDSRGRLNVRA